MIFFAAAMKQYSKSSRTLRTSFRYFPISAIFGPAEGVVGLSFRRYFFAETRLYGAPPVL